MIVAIYSATCISTYFMILSEILQYQIHTYTYKVQVFLTSKVWEKIN